MDSYLNFACPGLIFMLQAELTSSINRHSIRRLIIFGTNLLNSAPPSMSATILRSKAALKSCLFRAVFSLSYAAKPSTSLTRGLLQSIEQILVKQLGRSRSNRLMLANTTAIPIYIIFPIVQPPNSIAVRDYLLPLRLSNAPCPQQKNRC